MSTLATYIILHINYASILKSSLLRQEKKLANETMFSQPSFSLGDDNNVWHLPSDDEC